MFKYRGKILISIFITLFFTNSQSVNAEQIDVNKIYKPMELNLHTTAYYSPEKNQTKYFQKNYEKEIMLNGIGRVTASGNTIYKGVVAAPRYVPFGTVIEIKDYGFTVVEDRGSAITHYEDVFRVDIWQGYGENALNKALNWGYKENIGWIYPPSIKNIEFYTFNSNLAVGDSGIDVTNLQKQLKVLGFFDHPITGYFGEITSESVYQYQLFKNIVPNKDFQGAGVFGPGTRKRVNFMNDSLKLIAENKKQARNELSPSDHYKELNDGLYEQTLSYGDVNYNVYFLQQKLSKLNLFNWPKFTYQYGDATRAAVLKFQLKYGVISSETDQGAGVFGPSTREKLREINV